MSKTYLKVLLVERGMRLGDFADKLGMTRQNLYFKLNKKGKFSDEQLKAIIEILNLNQDEVYKLLNG